MLVTIEDVEGYDVIGSGSVISFNLQPIKLKILGDAHDTHPLYLIVQFHNDTSNSEMNIGLKSSGDTLTLDLTNYNEALGAGPLKPIKVGATDEGKDIHVNFRCYSNGATVDKLFFWTIYAVDSSQQPEGEKKNA